MKVTLEIGKQFPEITGESSDSFAKELIKMEDSDYKHVILDFDGTNSINSMAMGSLFASHQKLSDSPYKISIPI